MMIKGGWRSDRFRKDRDAEGSGWGTMSWPLAWMPVVVVVAFIVCIGQAGAQSGNSGLSVGPSLQLSTPLQAGAPYFQEPPLPNPPHLLGDPFGLRRGLDAQGISFLLQLQTEFAGNVSGGLRRSAADDNQIGLESDIDWSRLAGIGGFSSHAVAITRFGGNAGRGYGDNLLRPQDFLNINAGNAVVHLVYAYGQETFARGRVDAAFGRLPVSLDYAASPLYCNFENRSFCGNPRALSANSSGFSVYPEPVWGGRLRLHPLRVLYIQLGLYTVESGTSQVAVYRSGFHLDGADIIGEEFPLELGYEPQYGRDALLGHYKIGAGYNNAPHPDLYVDASGSAIVQSRQPPRIRHGSTEGWLLFDQMVFRNGPGITNGLIVFGGFVRPDATTSTYGDQSFIGLIDRGFLRARPRDAVGIAFSTLQVSPSLTATEQLDLQRRRPFGTGITGVQSHEQVLETFYDVRFLGSIDIQPDLMYVFRPNAQGNIRDALVLALMSRLTF